MLGNAELENSTVPVKLDLRDIKDIGAGCFQSMAIDKEDQIWVWGENWNGQLGIGNYQRQLTPTKSLIDFNNIMQVKAEQVDQIHDEAKAVLGLETPVQSIDAPDPFRNFVAHNKKFLLSFLLNVFLLILLLRKKNITLTIGQKA